MCGFNAITGLPDDFKSRDSIMHMNRSIEHRGPDDVGQYIAPGVALGHRRLSIIDLSEAGHQPMFSNSRRYFIVYNGELYNFKELKKELRAYEFKTETDTEVILAAFEKWGTDCFEKFNGMFGLAIWDTQEQQLIIARDAIGKKPVYIAEKEGVFVISSEMRAIMHSKLIQPELDRTMLPEYLSYQTVFAPNTILKGIKMLMPGHFAIIKSGQIIEKPFWSLKQARHKHPITGPYDKVCKQVKDLFFASVERRMIADVPLGAFLSGGIDSSAVVAAMAQISETRVNTFNVHFGEKQFDESEFANIIAKKYNTVHHQLLISEETFLGQLPQALEAMDHPSGDGPNTWVVSKATKEAGITVALSGLGGDELFGGYDIFKHAMWLKKKQFISRVPKPIRTATAKLYSKFKGGSSGNKISAVLGADNLGLANVYPEFRRTIWENDIEKLMGSSGLYPCKNLDKILDKIEPEGKTITEYSIAEMSTYMQNTLLRDTDQMAMAHALEVRVPFLDLDLIELVLSLPDDFKPLGHPKQLLTDAMGSLIPEEIWNRKKMGFTFPWETWMKSELNDFCEEQLQYLMDKKVFDAAHLQFMWDEFKKGNPEYTWTRIWILVVLGHWLKQHQIVR